MEPDPFANFSFKPPRTQGPFRTFGRNRSKYKYMSASSREKFGRSESTSSIASITGSTQNLLDPAKVMSMQEDARSRKITSEVMKSRLYESVIVSPRKRRYSMRADCGGGMGAIGATDMQAYCRMVQSLPVTPAHSQNVTPAHSPTQNRKFMFGYFSRGTTPHCMTPEELEEEEGMECEGEESWKGLASLFKPQPRFISGARYPATAEGGEEQAMECDMADQAMGLMPPPENPGFKLLNVPVKAKRSS